MAAIGKLTIKRLDLIAKVESNRDRARAEHERQYGSEAEFKKAREAYAKELVKYQKELASYFRELATCVQKATPEQVEQVGHGYRASDTFSQLQKPTMPREAVSRTGFAYREFDPSGYDEVIELLNLATDETITLSGIQYESYLKGRLDHRKRW